MGIYAFIAGVVAIIVAFLFGKRSSTTKIKGEVTIQRERAERAEQIAEVSKNVSENVVALSKSNEEIKTEISEAEQRLEMASQQRDTNEAINIAKRLAKIAEGLL